MTKKNDETNELVPKDAPGRIGNGAHFTTIPLDAIVDTDETQIREMYNEYAVTEFERIYREESTPGHNAGEETLPPISVVPCPGRKGKYWILDGHHRYRAASRTKRSEIRAMIVTLRKEDNLVVKSIEDLQFLQARENRKTVACRTPETKRRQVRAALVKRPNWTTRQIAYYCSVSFELADSVRKQMEKEGAIEIAKKPAEKAAEAVANPENDQKSNRQIAKETGVGEATVRRLRQKSKSTNDAAQKPRCANCGCKCVSDNPIFVLDKDGETTLPFCDNVCAEYYADKNGLSYDDDDKRLYSNDDDVREAHALNNVSKKAQEFIDNHAPAAPEKEPYKKPEVLDAPPASADDKTVTKPLTPEDIVTIDNDGIESRCVGYALPIDLPADDVVEIVLAALSYKYNSVMDVANKLIQAAKQQCSVNGVTNNPPKR